MSVKVLVADDHHIIRHGLVSLIKSDSEFDIIAEAEDGLQAYEKIKKLKPDIAVLDISMPKINGLKLARKLMDEGISLKIVILTMHKGQEYFNEALEIGVKGYILKENSAEDLITALKSVSNDKAYFSPILSEYLLSNHNKVSALKSLSPAEKRILKLISLNKTSRDIAEELSVSFRTVQNHRSNISAKLQIEGRNALFQFAIENKAII